MRTSKYTKPQKKQRAETPETSKPMAKENNTKQDDVSENESANPAEDHRKFRDSLIETVQENKNEPTLEPLISAEDNPHSLPKEHRDYSLDGIRKQPKENPLKPPATETLTDDQTDTVEDEPAVQHADREPVPPADDFEPTPPSAEDDAPENIISGDGQSPPEGGTPFTIPSGTAKDMIKWGANALNYLIGNFGDLVVGIPIHPSFYLLDGAVDEIKQQNARNVERLKITDQEVEMLSDPLTELMQEKGIRGFSASEKVIGACVIIFVGKVKVVIQIRRENKKLYNSLVSKMEKIEEKLNRMEKQYQSKFGSVKSDEPELVVAETV